MILVAGVDGAVVGLGGINIQEQAEQRLVALGFGMVHPAHQRKGLGSTLLPSRLALIDAQTAPITAMLTTVGGSETFYGRFGFFYVQSVAAEDGFESKHYVARLGTDTRQRCLAAPSRARLAPAPRGAVVPSFASIFAVASCDVSTALAT